ncbi:MAG: endonuclease/exonuclease/phosphatase family protein [Bacteroidetes bacterium]|nr:endonuclease/exonuclease/phosphatase family protein [Bacteroidota bacterium]
MKKLKTILSIFFRIAYFIFLLSLLLSYFAPYANPKPFWLFAFFGLAYPWLLIVNVLFLIWWIIRWKKLYWLSLIAILIGWNDMKNLFHFGSGNQNTKGGIKVLSYNVRNFDLYNWTHNTETRNKIFSFLKNESADIVCLQEFFQGDSGYFETLDTLIELTQSVDHHVKYTLTRRKTDHWGIATFSKYPILFKGKIPFKYKSNSICIFSDLKIGEDTVRVYNMHLQSISFGYADYRFIEALKKNNDTLDVEDIEIASKNILRRIKHAFIKRATQTEKILAHINACKYPVIICGDFNDTPFSYTYHAFAEKYLDSFMESGSGIGNTYIGDFPSYRIDYIFHSSQFTSSNFEIHSEELSDHYPVSCTLKPLPSSPLGR